MKSPQIFISHSWKDKFFVNKLAEQLQARGVNVWVDSAELKVGDSLLASIGNAISECDAFAIVLSHNSISSGWVQRELQLSMNLVLEKKNKRILPILIESCEVPFFLRDLVYADFTDPLNFDSALLRILAALGIEARTAVVIEPPAHSQQQPEPVSPDLTGFQDIAIAEVEKSQSYKPDPQKLLYNIYLRLSDIPPSEWVEIFDAERQFPRHSMWRRAWVESNCIVIHCVPDELKQYHLRDLKEDVTNSNSKYRQQLMDLERQRLSKKKRDNIEKSTLDNALKNLEL